MCNELISSEYPSIAIYLSRYRLNNNHADHTLSPYAYVVIYKLIT